MTELQPNRPPLQPSAMIPLALGAVQPRGWLRDQCRLQADGLTGHLESAWPDLGPDNMWLGGRTEGWERGPYYLDGLVPLAYILDDAPLKARAQRWIESILSMQTADGWIGPVEAPGRKPYDPWPIFILMKVLTQYHDAVGDPRVIPFLSAFCGYLARNLEAQPLRDWGQHRWADGVLSIHWLYNRTGDENLLDVARILAVQGYDWRLHFADFHYTSKTPREACILPTHVVNNAMAIKSGGVWWRQSGDPDDRQSVYQAIAMLDRYHGQATGIFTGDEHYAGLEPTQGAELCAVVEYMYSLEELLAILGDPALADRLERIACNALPGTCTADMWAHQYDQQANQTLCTIAPRPWTNNLDDSNIYGLEPNFGCCTANYHQGWPKLVRHLWMATPEGGLAAVAYGPSELSATVGGVPLRIHEETEYPFKGEIRLRIDPSSPLRFPLALRVPAWAGAAEWTARTKDRPEERAVAEAGWCTMERVWHAGDTITLRIPMEVRREVRSRGAVVLHRGPLVFSLPIGIERTLIKGVPAPKPGERSPDWELRPTTPWNYALHADGPMRIHERSVSGIPFDPENPPVTLEVVGRRVPGWTMQENNAGPVPASPVQTHEADETLRLVPYGSAPLRITEFPVCPE